MAKLNFWINAFIPGTVKGYTVVLTKGVHKGKSAVPLPNVATLWPGNWDKDILGKTMPTGYLTDQRSFDQAQSASCRMQSSAVINLATNELVSSDHTTSGTVEINFKTGAETGAEDADMSRCSLFKIKDSDDDSHGSRPFGGVGAHLRPSQGPTTFPGQGGRPSQIPTKFGLIAAAGDPLVGMAADIDYNGTITVSPPHPSGAVKITFNGMIDAFPAYECYASCNGVTKTLFRINPPPGNTVVNLLGGANIPVKGSATFS